MNLIRLILPLVMLVSAAPVALAQPVTPAPVVNPPTSFADVVEKLSPAVVNISSTQKVKGGGQTLFFGMPFENMPNTPEFEPFREFFDRFGQVPGEGIEREAQSLGSGFIIDAEGHVITNSHVTEGAEEITVTLTDNTKYEATVVGRDAKTDLALLKIEPKKPLPFVKMGDSDAMRVGDWVIAIGNPFGLGGSVTQGIISARQRSINAGPFDDFLQTDAPINRGNSGGPLINMQGEVIGINTAIFSPTGGSIGIGFAIPTALAMPVIDQLKQFGRTHRGWLGVKIQVVSEEIADSVGLDRTRGALVLEVSKDGPAAKGGLEPGDVITAFDGREVAEMRNLPRIVAETKIGKTVPVVVWRKGAAKTLQVTLGENPDEDAKAVAAAPKKADGKAKGPSGQTVLGMEVTPVTPGLRESRDLGDKAQGLLVLDVERGAEAAARGIRPGDVIADVNGEAVKTADALKKAFDAARAKGRKFALVKIQRGKDSAFIPLPVVEEGKEKR